MSNVSGDNAVRRFAPQLSAIDLDDEDSFIRQNNEDVVSIESQNTEEQKTIIIDSQVANEVEGYDPENYPGDNNELKSWIAVTGSFFGLLPVFGFINSLGAIEAYISKHQLANVESTTISWIFSLYLAIAFISTILTGAYFDRNGGLKPMIVGTLMYFGGMFAMASCTKLYQFILSFSVVSGMGCGICTTPLVSIVNTHFYVRRPLANSINTLGGSLGGLIFPITLKKLYSEVGFVWAVRIVALFCLFCLIVATVFAKENKKSGHHQKQEFANRAELLKWYFSTCFNIKYLKDWKFVFASLGASFSEVSMTVSATFFTSYSIMAGNSSSTAYLMSTILNAVGIFARLSQGLVAQRYGTYNVIIACAFTCVIWNFILWLGFGTNSKALWAYVVLYGFSSSSIFSLTPVCIAKISSTSEFGRKYSTAYMIQAILTLPVFAICGKIIGNGDNKGNYDWFIVFSSCLMAMGTACYLVTRTFCVGKRICIF
ncbi:hypothetical protein QEN19_004059 [Hanseniaspora menglaensis]